MQYQAAIPSSSTNYICFDCSTSSKRMQCFRPSSGEIPPCPVVESPFPMPATANITESSIHLFQAECERLTSERDLAIMERSVVVKEKRYFTERLQQVSDTERCCLISVQPVDGKV
jgi:hypothetical protein